MQCKNCGNTNFRCGVCDEYHETANVIARREGFTIKTEASQARLLQTINDELHKHGYSMLIPENLSIAMLNSGAIIVCHPERKPITILINVVDPYRAKDFIHNDGSIS